MLIKKITKGIFPVWEQLGVPVVAVTFSKEEEETSMNSAFEQIKKINIKNISIKVSIKNNPDIVELVKGLTSVGCFVSIITDGTDSIEVLRRFKNVRFVIKVDAPTEKQNNVNRKNLPLLKEEDELYFKLESGADFENAKRFLGSIMITRPTVLFAFLNDEVQGSLFTKILDYSIGKSFRVRTTF